jgi:hypothetical protein
MQPPSPEANNNDLLVWSLYLLNGAETWVDVEEMYLKAFELAPARLSWRTRADIPDYKKVSKALQSVEAPDSKHEGLLVKQGSYDRKLTMAGLAWCEEFSDQLHLLYSGAVVSSANSQTDARRIKEIESSPCFQRWMQDRASVMEGWELAEIFRCLPTSPPATWIERFDASTIAARRNGRSDVEKYIQSARTQIL